MSPADLLTAPAVASLLGVSDESVRRWADEGRITFITLPSGQRRYRRADVEAILTPDQPTDEAAS